MFKILQYEISIDERRYTCNIGTCVINIQLDGYISDNFNAIGCKCNTFLSKYGNLPFEYISNEIDSETMIHNLEYRGYFTNSLPDNVRRFITNVMKDI